MSIHAQIALYSPEEKEAFAEFLKISASVQRNQPKETFGLAGLVGGIDHAPGGWINKATVQNIEAAQAELPLEAPAPAAEEPKKERKPRAKKEAAPIEVPATTAEVKVQDEADEQAESEAAAEERGRTLTHDDIRAELGKYVKKFGMPAAQEDGPKLFAKAFPGKGIMKIGDIPDDQAALGTALSGVQELLVKNPFGRELAA